MKNPQKGFATSLLLAIIVVLMIGGGVYYYSQNKREMPISPSVNESTHASTTDQNQVASWKTYANTQYGFSFQYPSIYNMTEGVEGNMYIVRLADNTSKNGIEVDYYAQETLNQFVSNAWYHAANDIYTTTNINGNSTVRYDLTVPNYGRNESATPQSYTRAIQAGIQKSTGGFLNVILESTFDSKMAAQNADMSWAQSILNTVVFSDKQTNTKVIQKQTVKPIITSAYSFWTTVGPSINIVGNGFTASNNINNVDDGSVTRGVPSTKNGTQIGNILPLASGDSSWVVGSQHKVSVTNENGTSNTFTVTIKEGAKSIDPNRPL